MESQKSYFPRFMQPSYFHGSFAHCQIVRLSVFSTWCTPTRSLSFFSVLFLVAFSLHSRCILVAFSLHSRCILDAFVKCGFVFVSVRKHLFASRCRQTLGKSLMESGGYSSMCGRTIVCVTKCYTRKNKL